MRPGPESFTQSENISRWLKERTVRLIHRCVKNEAAMGRGAAGSPAEEGRLLSTRLSLLARLKNWEDQESWEDFFNTYWRLIYATALKSGLTDAEAQYAVQETLLAVVRNIKEFQYDKAKCSFKSWLLLITRQRIIWVWRKRPPTVARPARPDDSTTETDLIEQLPDPANDTLDRIWEEEWQKNLMAAALERVKRLVSARQFQIFDLHVLQNWPVSEVTQTLHVNVGQVYLAKHRVSALLKKTVRALELGAT